MLLAWDTGHAIDCDEVQIKTCMSHFYKRVALETSYMRSQPHALNREEGILPAVYSMLISGSGPHVHGSPSHN